ncbi:dimethyl sulfoxide reductase anchor subunit family protein [Salisediminibacterium halotolerans]|uniref:dimethyl sulfoxide reductase anchor subunit family protein n=1 Tax=Salisediminibacterium halotolerans TaxID=517425 RepID=UPI000EB599D5|nr:DmsC/YnfH family molybdoenzyme membrane anchor subunit [Salisediminibacterium halotolerans]RLJ75732.1 anaerobic dimethyl sulfoxide reductase subunit C (anchor subunit) [Actinophytocola xinjiangensis]RPE89586.1 anaerobic dimethyl sulfoxide reductase subunit C (anchor subunit) [Salisediminibacterium halotolerans]TWG36345.1 anaerobic dimethyl sulfoxide reductase subunit C (anchor subunit) [Salisediminibacterium halotolerans]GEL09205.1 DMSO reductase subunit C [Salisediminibacterium halotolerans
MFYEEWPLIFFTLLGQLAAGTFILLTAGRLYLEKHAPKADHSSWFQKSTLSIAGVMVLAIVMSAFHIGTWSNMLYMIANVGSSWLAREIVFAGLFLAMVVAVWLTERAGRSMKVLHYLTSAVGIACVYAMASVYATTIIPAWSHVNTYFAHFGTMFVLGVLGAGLCFILFRRDEAGSPEQVGLMKRLAFAGAAAVILQLVVLPVYLTGLADGGAAGTATLNILFAGHTWTMVLRWGLTLAGGVLLLYSLFRYSERIYTKVPAQIYTAVIFVIAGEFVGRYLFYLTGIPTQIG